VGALDRALARELTPLLAEAELRARMGLAMQRLARPDAAAEIAAAVYETLYGARTTRVAA
jgi:hypothetical protein